MPHVTLEYTKNILEQDNLRPLLLQIHQVISETAGIDKNNCKSRALCRDTYTVGTGEANNAFVHLEIRILEGRTVKLKQEVAQRCLDLLQEFYAKSAENLALQITVEMQDIQRQSYLKYMKETTETAI